MIFKKSDKIQFISTVEHLNSINECLPKPAKQFIPKWFKDIPLITNDSVTVKNCPSFPDYFSQGYILPMWCDVLLQYDKETDNWQWHTSTKNFTWEIHGKGQLLDHTQVSFNGLDAHFVFKANCPWKVITPPGWSVLQLPLFYHFNKEWSVLPGIIDTDIHHSINQQVLYHGNKTSIVIKKGDPFVLYIPFKRSNKLKHKISYQTEKNKKYFDRLQFAFNQNFTPNGVYRNLQRKRDKGV